MYDYFKAFINNALDHLDEGVYFIDSGKNILYWNGGAENLTGYRPDEVALKKCCDIIAHIGINGEKLCDKQCPVVATLNQNKLQEKDIYILHKEGHRIPVTVKTLPVYTKEGQLSGVIELVSDKSQRKIGHEQVKALTKAAYIDSLSELFSKQYIENRLQTMLKELPDKGQSFSILYINITGFRAINDLYSVSRADKVLKMVAKTLSAGITYPDIIGRWHGASFIAIVETANKGLLLLLADKLKTLVAESGFPINGETIHVNVSVTHAIAQSYDTLDYLVERATKPSLEEKLTAASLPPADKTSTAGIEKQEKKPAFHSISAIRRLD